MDRNYWSDFAPVAERDLDTLENRINRRLPSDLRTFLLEFGCGRFPLLFGDCVYSPEELYLGCTGPILMACGAERGMDAEQLCRFYISRGNDNPAPERYTPTQLNRHHVSAFDLLQVGSDGSCGYHQVFVGDDPRPFGYCLLHEAEMYDRLPSFGAGLRKIFNRHWALSLDRLKM
jgi:hypothetical protein